MIRLQTLGRLDLTADVPFAGLRDLAHQHKRIALLIYLCHRAAQGPVRRDTLLGVFWPEATHESARHALSQALYILRNTLGNGVIEPDGAEALRVDHTKLSSDVLALDALLAEDRLAEAVELFQGDFLEGFHLPDAPEFGRWVDLERERTRGAVVAAIERLTAEVAAGGSTITAARWARRAVEIAPYDEPAVVRLTGLLHDAGDHAGAVLEFDRFRERLQRDLGLVPSEAAERHAAGLRQPTEGVQVARIAPRPAVVSATRPVAPAVRAVGPPHLRRRWMGVALAGVAAVLLWSAWASSDGLGTGTPAGAAGRVVVTMPAADPRDSAAVALAQVVRDGLADALIGGGIGDVHLGERPADRAAAVVLGGRVRRVGSAFLVSLHAIGPGGEGALFAVPEVTVSPGSGDEALADLHAAAAVALALHLDPRFRGWGARASQPRDLASFQRYARAFTHFGEIAHPAAAAEVASEMLETWRADSTFTAPLIWAMFAFLDAVDIDRADSIAHLLARDRERLATWDRLAVDYLLAHMDGDLRSRYRAAAAVERVAPTAFWRFHLAEAAGDVGCREEALGILLAIDPREGPMWRVAREYWSLRLDLRHLLGDPAGEAADAELASRDLTDEAQPGQYYRVVAARVRAAAAAGRLEDERRRLGEVRTLGSRAGMLYAKLLYWGPLDLSTGSEAKRAILDSARAWYADRGSPESCSVGVMSLTIAYHLADWAAADSIIATGLTVRCVEDESWRRGTAAVLAERLGNHAGALSLLEGVDWDGVTGHYRHIAEGDPLFWSARLAAIRGDGAQAVGYLRAANRRGVAFASALGGTARVDFESIRDYGPMQALLEDRTCTGLGSGTRSPGDADVPQ